MKWTKGGPYHIESDAGYKVCRVVVRGEDRFEAWPPKPKGPRHIGFYVNPAAIHQMIGSFPDIKSAQRACESYHALDISPAEMNLVVQDAAIGADVGGVAEHVDEDGALMDLMEPAV